MFDLEEELKKLPNSPGVYLMHDKQDQIIYVGKAVNLKNRVRQYFQAGRNVTSKIEQMISLIDHFEYIVTDSELEALVLECNLIKEHSPKYNTMLKDGKGYPFIKVTLGEAYPRIMLAYEIERTKKEERNKVKYFGPYTSMTAVKDIIELIRKIFCVRTCSRNLPKDIGKQRPCLYYDIHQCKAPCAGYISKEEYRKNFGQVLDFLNGNFGEILSMLEEKMKNASERMEYEEAAEYRDLINSVRHIAQRQKITSSELADRDMVGLARTKDEAVVQVFFIRSGKLIGREHFYFKNISGETNVEIITAFIKQFYAGTPYIPRELYIQEEIEEGELLADWLTTKKGQKVLIKVPKKGEKERLVELAIKNASIVLQKDAERIQREEAKTKGALKQLGDILNLIGLNRIESFDISNTNGFESVGSMVVFENGKPKRADYRKFKIKSVKGPDDYASMYEVLTRRLAHGIREREELRRNHKDESLGSFTKFPELILMDGGRGQVNIALKVLDELKLNIPVCGMVKDDNHRTRGLYYNNVELSITENSEVFRLITRIQDETHRFAIEYHRSLRGKAQVKSVLDEIEGVGEVRRKALLRYFKSVEKIREATVSELAEVPSMNEQVAQKVYQFFH
ncbi:excinuclease ABC subunit UvrC [Anaeromicropila populeti]|uniref:UvrABC system protein C n=1 Tax=Anaeromicropila populeti TaxID=37658 RepID=A0A1I6JYQ3_9FIRM|nr:excinuclease ABC subunit UvrC [Anaeromicropila populeti]SFR84096.1 Excinuclease ABC subunit C [Anaeromicropila populeti]